MKPVKIEDKHADISYSVKGNAFPTEHYQNTTSFGERGQAKSSQKKIDFLRIETSTYFKPSNNGRICKEKPLKGSSQNRPDNNSQQLSPELFYPTSPIFSRNLQYPKKDKQKNSQLSDLELQVFLPKSILPHKKTINYNSQNSSEVSPPNLHTVNDSRYFDFTASIDASFKPVGGSFRSQLYDGSALKIEPPQQQSNTDNKIKPQKILDTGSKYTNYSRPLKIGKNLIKSSTKASSLFFGPNDTSNAFPGLSTGAIADKKSFSLNLNPIKAGKALVDRKNSKVNNQIPQIGLLESTNIDKPGPKNDSDSNSVFFPRLKTSVVNSLSFAQSERSDKLAFDSNDSKNVGIKISKPLVSPSKIQKAKTSKPSYLNRKPLRKYGRVKNRVFSLRLSDIEEVEESSRSIYSNRNSQNFHCGDVKIEPSTAKTTTTPKLKPANSNLSSNLNLESVFHSPKRSNKRKLNLENISEDSLLKRFKSPSVSYSSLNVLLSKYSTISKHKKSFRVTKSKSFSSSSGSSSSSLIKPSLNPMNITHNGKSNSFSGSSKARNFASPVPNFKPSKTFPQNKSSAQLIFPVHMPPANHSSSFTDNITLTGFSHGQHGKNGSNITHANQIAPSSSSIDEDETNQETQPPSTDHNQHPDNYDSSSGGNNKQNQKKGYFSEGPFKKFQFNFLYTNGVNRFGSKHNSVRATISFFIYCSAGVINLALLGAWSVIVSTKICTINSLYSPDFVQQNSYYSSLGSISTLKGPADDNIRTLLYPYRGMDVSEFFAPYDRFLSFSKTDKNLNVSNSFLENPDAAKNWIHRRYSDASGMLDTQNPSQFLNLSTEFDKFQASKIGTLLLNEVHAHHYVTINSSVYDFSTYFRYALVSSPEQTSSFNSSTSFMSPELTTLIFNNKGHDISDGFFDIAINPNVTLYYFDKLFYRGTAKGTLGAYICTKTNLFGDAIALITLLVVLSQITAYIVNYNYQKYKNKTYKLKAPANSVKKPPIAENHVDSSKEARSVGANAENSTDDGSSDLPRLHSGFAGGLDGNSGSRVRQDVQNTPNPRKKLSKKRKTKNQLAAFDSGYVMIAVTVFNESIDMISSTLQSIARSSFPNNKSSLFIVVDGNKKILKDILRMVAYVGNDSGTKMYGSQGQEVSKTHHNPRNSNSEASIESGNIDTESYVLASVYSGVYECGAYRIPYVIVAKHSYQGHLDSLMLTSSLFRFQCRNIGSMNNINENQKQRFEAQHGSSGLNILTSGAEKPRQFAPQSLVENSQNNTIFLEDELDARYCGLDRPLSLFSYCVVLDAGMEVEHSALEYMVRKMEANPRIISLQGSIKSSMRKISISNLIQSYTIHIRHKLKSTSTSLFSMPDFQDQSFAIYRVWYNDKEMLGNPELSVNLLEFIKPTSSNQHLWWQRGDFMLLFLLNKTFPNATWGYTPLAVAWVRLSMGIQRLDAYERQFYKTKVRLLFELLMSFNTNAVVSSAALLSYMSLVLRASTSPLLYIVLLASLLLSQNNRFFILGLTGAFIGLVGVLYTVTGRFRMFVFFLVYTIFGVPFYEIWIPLTAIFTMNRIWTHPDRIAAEQTSTADLKE